MVRCIVIVVTNKRKKVLIVITKSSWGGAQTYVYDLASQLPREQFDVVVVLGGDGELQKKLKEQNIRTITIKALQRDINLLKEFRVFHELIKLLRTERPDVLHVNSSKAGGLGALAGRITNIPNIIFTAHGWAFKEKRGVLTLLLLRILSWITVLLTHKTIVVSRDDYEKSNWMPLTRRKIVYIPVAPSEIHYEEKEKARSILTGDNPRKTLYIGTISELHPNKGLTCAIDAVGELVENGYDIVFVIIGTGEKQTMLEKYITKKGLEEHIMLSGFVPDAARYLKALDIFTLTSIKEGLPYAALEAGNAELPVVATNVGGIPEIVTDMKSGILVRPENTHEIARALTYLIEHPDQRTEFGKNLKESVSALYSRAQMISKTSALY